MGIGCIEAGSPARSTLWRGRRICLKHGYVPARLLAHDYCVDTVMMLHDERGYVLCKLLYKIH